MNTPATDRIVLDSSGWIEWISSGPGAARFRAVLEEPDRIIVPTIVMYETSRWSLSRSDVKTVQRTIVRMRLSEIIGLDADLAAAAAQLSIGHKLAMADSIILATAQRFGAELWTQDADFQGLSGVRYFTKP